MANSQHYLKELKKELEKYTDQIKSLTDKDGHKKLSALLLKISKKEEELRKDSEIGARYHVIHNQIKDLLDTYSLQKHVALKATTKQRKSQEPTADEQRVYVYLFNAQGENIVNWHKLFLPSSLAEHSINRPIYVDETQLRKNLISKQNPTQHGYLSAIINKGDILREYRTNSASADETGEQLLRLKENAITLDKIEYFWHEDKKYCLSKDGYLELLLSNS